MTYAHNSAVVGVRFQGQPSCNNVYHREIAGSIHPTNCGNPGHIMADGTVRCTKCIGRIHYASVQEAYDTINDLPLEVQTEALAEVVCHNILQDELGFAIEVLACF